MYKYPGIAGAAGAALALSGCAGEGRYAGGWFFLAVLLFGLVILLLLVIRYLAAGRKEIEERTSTGTGTGTGTGEGNDPFEDSQEYLE